MQVFDLTPLVLLLPLLGFLIIASLRLFNAHERTEMITWIGCGSIALAFLCALFSFLTLINSVTQADDLSLWNWVVSGNLGIDLGLRLDPLSGVMLLVVTGVGFLIHVYSAGYMHGDPGYWRYYSFLNFFIFAMALLVTANNFLFLLIGWAAVGLASYLLIGFWYQRPSAVAAAKKAFVVNVIGDFGLMLAIFLLYNKFGTLAYNGILFSGPDSTAAAPQAFGVNDPMLIAITLLLFLACAAKSAQLPLHVWLPDAMEGPTPVSALIHAATMVTAGVYLVARASNLFQYAPTSLWVVAGIGAGTAIFAASVGLVQNDIKRVLAYSTISQLGYMFMAEGAGNSSAGIFHLTTHAYFKALLFMCAGAVIHTLDGEQDIRKMGGLRARMPWTYWTFLIGGLAITGIVPFAGFWSKDAILGSLLALGTAPGGNPWYLVLYGVGLATAILTGFYIFRVIFVVFHGSYRGGEAPTGAQAEGQARKLRRGNPLARVHEAPWIMLAPMVVLAILSTIGGLYGTPWTDALGQFLTPVLGNGFKLDAFTLQDGMLWISFGAGLAAGLIGIGVAASLYVWRTPRLQPMRNFIYQTLLHKYWLDELYDWVIVKPIVGASRLANRFIEGDALDGGSRGLAWLVGKTSVGLRTVQSGYVRNYALVFLLGAILILLYYIARP
ncbi:MAG TPA: NADH-quinone oxidoreductase subunit L [Ktedonobacterales bacterium]|jgi:NADH-quinone oxidoreductase subunit L